MGNDPGMIGRFKSNWEEFKAGKPGDRFKERYYRRQEGGSRYLVSRIFYIVLGTLVAFGSLLTAPLPGPGFATVFLGLAMLSSEFLPAARLCDWTEVWLRQLWQFVKDVWSMGAAGKVAVISATAILVISFLYVAYLLLFA